MEVLFSLYKKYLIYKYIWHVFIKLLICNVHNITSVVIVAEVFSTLCINAYVKNYKNYYVCMYNIHVKFV